MLWSATGISRTTATTSATKPDSENTNPTRWPTSQRMRRSLHDAPWAIALFTASARVTAIAAAKVQRADGWWRARQAREPTATIAPISKIAPKIAKYRYMVELTAVYRSIGYESFRGISRTCAVVIVSESAVTTRA